MNLLLKSVAKIHQISVQNSNRLCVQLEMHTPLVCLLSSELRQHWRGEEVSNNARHRCPGVKKKPKKTTLVSRLVTSGIFLLVLT